MFKHFHIYIIVVFLGLTAQGCGEKVRKTYYMEPPVPMDSDTATVTSDEPVVLPTFGGILVNTIMDHQHPYEPYRDTAIMENFALYRFIAAEDDTALRELKLRITQTKGASKTVNKLNMTVSNPQSQVYIGGSADGEVNGMSQNFSFSADKHLELGFLKKTGDELSISVHGDTSDLDGCDFKIEVISMTVSIGGGTAQELVDNLPKPITVRFREHSRLKHEAYLRWRVDETGTDTVLAEVKLTNKSAKHDNSVTLMNFINSGIYGATNLRLIVDGKTYTMTESNGFLIADMSSDPLVLQPGEKTVYKVVADTTTTYYDFISIKANGVNVIVDHGSEQLEIYEGGARNIWGSLVSFITELGVELSITQVSITTTGPFNGREVFKGDMISTENIYVRGCAYKIIDSVPSAVAELHMEIDTVDYASHQEQVGSDRTLEFSPFSSSFFLEKTKSSEIAFPLYLNTNQTGETVQFELHAIIDDWGRAHMVHETGPAHLVN